MAVTLSDSSLKTTFKAVYLLVVVNLKLLENRAYLFFDLNSVCFSGILDGNASGYGKKRMLVRPDDKMTNNFCMEIPEFLRLGSCLRRRFQDSTEKTQMMRALGPSAQCLLKSKPLPPSGPSPRIS
uniref:Uncharacterized protein n=1 Tax=Salix viminalis TaxID=40686 RepID=A0A6N2M2E6_SALVM